MSLKGELTYRPWVVVAPDGVVWIGLAQDEADSWKIALGWPDDAEINSRKAAGWYAAPASITWSRP